MFEIADNAFALWAMSCDRKSDPSARWPTGVLGGPFGKGPLKKNLTLKLKKR